MIDKDHLQRLLREFQGPLADVEVKHKDSATALLMPHEVIVTGICRIHGHPLAYETEIDLRKINGPDEVLAFAGKLLESFRQAEKNPELAGE